MENKESVNSALNENKIPIENILVCVYCGSKLTANNKEDNIPCNNCGFKMNPSLDFYNLIQASIPANARLNIETLPDLKIGDEFVYGRVCFRELIWKVIDIKDNRIEAICLSCEDSLNYQPYNKELVPVTWKTCTLRRFLNEEFLVSAFSEEECNRIIKTNVISEDNSKFGTSGGESTYDKVFILSEGEATHLIHDDFHRNINGWWLRTPGYQSLSASFYRNGVDVIGIEVNKKGNIGASAGPGTRPVIWIETSEIPRFKRESYYEIKTNYKKGDDLEFGFDPHRGPIKWRVLDVKDNRVLIITSEIFRKMLFAKKQEDDYDYVPLWENSLLRKWLNEEFLNNYLSADERKRVLTTDNSNNNVKKYDDSIVEAHTTNDKVFLLSEEDANSYFSSNDERCCEKCTWMLRTTDTYWPKGIDYTGEIKGVAGINSYGGVRPAMWIDLTV